LTTAQLLTKFRSIFDETTAGFIIDNNDAYPMLASGRNECIQWLLSKQREIKLVKPHYECESLKPLIKLDTGNTTTVGAGLQEYNLPSDFIETYSARYDPTSTASDLSYATLLPFAEIMRRQGNTYEASTLTNNFYYYIRLTKLGFFPQPTGGAANKYEHYYYYQPAEIASGVEPVLTAETHEAILLFALSFAFMKDGNSNKSAYYRGEAIKKLQALI